MNREREAKVQWFMKLHGCSEADARKFLQMGGWKMKAAYIEYKRYWNEVMRNERTN